MSDWGHFFDHDEDFMAHSRVDLINNQIRAESMNIQKAMEREAFRASLLHDEPVFDMETERRIEEALSSEHPERAVEIAREAAKEEESAAGLIVALVLFIGAIMMCAFL